jgi:uncharacterized protein with HEPN domain
MPERDWRFRVRDMLDFIGRIRGCLAGIDEEEFHHNTLLMDASLEIWSSSVRHRLMFPRT